MSRLFLAVFVVFFILIASGSVAAEVDGSDGAEDGEANERPLTEEELLEAELDALEAELDEDLGEPEDLDEPEDLGEPEDLDEEELLDDELEALEEELAPTLDELGQEISGMEAKAPSRTIGSAASGAVQSMNPDISLIADFALAWFSDEPSLVGGHDPYDPGFNLQGLELSISAAIDPYFRFDSFIILTLFGIEVEEAFGTTLGLPFSLQARVGQFLTNFGRANPTHLHAWNFVIQPLAMGKFFGGEGLRGLGIELSQLTPLPWFAEWNLAVQNIGGGATGRSFFSTTEEIDSLLDLTVTARLEQYWDLTDNVGTLLGLSAANGPNSTGRDNRSDVFGADLLLKWNPSVSGGYREVGWQNEFLLRRRQAPGSVDEEAGTVLQDWGGYSELYYSPSLFWRFATRYEYVAGIDDDYLDPQWDEDRQRVAASISYYPSHFSRIRFEYNADFMPYRTDLDNLVHMAFVQLELVAGAHGAHRY